MDDVDRLFDCFKCGVSPPQSAMRERKIFRDKSKKASSTQGENSAFSASSSPGSARQRQQNTLEMQLCLEKVGHLHYLHFTRIKSNKSALLGCITHVAVISAGLCMQSPPTSLFGALLGTKTVKSMNCNSGKQFSPVVFYGSPHGVPAKRPSRLLRLLHEIHDDLTEQNDLSAREEVWATFPRQDEAMQFAKRYAHVHVFSYQDHLNGQRRFLVSTYTEFWRRYKNMDSKFRHHYEVIQEGLPCHLYFDLEFNRRGNAGKNGDEMVDLLISVILDALLEKYSIQGNLEWIVELDSSTEEKFSRHLIIRIPETAFKDNSHAGAFIAEICSRIYSARESNRRLEKLFVSKDLSSVELPCQLFVDTAVYSRNRCFRLALSSKAGKNSVLLPTWRFKCKNMSEEEMFMESLICKMDVDCKKLLICKMDLDCVKTLHFDSEVNGNIQNYFNVPQQIVPSSCTRDVPSAYFMGKSPFPALDKFVESIASIGNVSEVKSSPMLSMLLRMALGWNVVSGLVAFDDAKIRQGLDLRGKIRSWYWFSEYGLMVYSMSRNRYCERIGRQHKSNHVMYIVDLRRAVYYQKCYDPDCKGYRSPLRLIPTDAVPDSMAVFNSVLVENHSGMTNNNLEQQFGEIGLEHILRYSDESITDTCKKDGWWLEAIRIADDIENMRKKPKFGHMVGLLAPFIHVVTFVFPLFGAMREMADDEDYEWWMAVERTASQAELQTHFN
ncbi:hypothetical protein HHK36_001207 [Tetracentron sinense]|uniref:DNA-directed primase/polymerase protein n=1 Tax=Tetracentron sinense TaxID=13715 RepID=A0A834ZTM7_TETSI|nr:hypothetical protein HHK36_001207 [Tetracentron sinense]